MSGILYGLGVGPGDPELLTLKALRLIRENPVIAVPGCRCSGILSETGKKCGVSDTGRSYYIFHLSVCT